MADKIKILELDISTESILAKSVQLKQDLDSARASVLELKKAGDTSSETYNTLSAQVSKLSTEYNLNQKQLVSLISTSGNLLTATEKANAIMEVEATTRKEAILQNRELIKIRDEINAKTPEGVLAIQQLNEKMDKNTEFIKDNSSSLEKQKINIGNYTEGINNSVIGTSIWGNKLNDLKGIHEGLKSSISQGKELLKVYADGIRDYSKGTEGMTLAQKASTIATNVSTSSLGLFKVALASTGVGLLVLALAGLIGYFTQTQSGIDKLNGVLQPLKAVFTAVYSVVVSTGEALVNAFSNPKKAMSDLVSFVETNLINRFKAFGVILDGIMNLDFKKVADGVLQAGTGVEGMTGKIAAAGQKTSEFLTDAAKKGQEVANLTKEINDLQLKYNANQIAVNDALDEQRLISKDTSKDYKERAKASEEIIRITEENGKQEAKILELKLKQLQVEQSLKGQKNLTNEDKQKTIDLLNQIDDAEDRGKEARLEQMRVLSGLAKEEKKNREDAAKANIEKQQKAIDLAIAETQAKINLFITEQGFRKKSLEEEVKFAKQLVEEEQALLKQKLEKKRISETEYQQKYLESANNYGKKLALLLAQNAEDELRVFLENNKTKLDDTKFLTDEMVAQEIQAYNLRSEAQAKFQTERLNQGIINEREYQEEIRKIDEEFKLSKDELEARRKEEENAKRLLDSENARIIQQEEFDNSFAIEAQNLELSREQELEDAKKNGADVALINDKYAQRRKKLDKSIADFRLEQELSIVQGLRGLFGEQTVVGKALALADVSMTTIINATKAFAQAAVFASNPVTAPLAINANIQGGIIVASGALQASKILGLKDGVVDLYGEGSETSDSIPAMLSRGESVTSAEKTKKFKPLLQSIRDSKDISYTEDGFAIPSSYVSERSSSSREGINYDLLAMKIAQANRELPAPNLSLEYFHQENNNYQNAVNLANH